MAHMDCCGPSRRQALLWGSLAAAVPAIVDGVSVESANASTTDLLVTDLEVATVTDTSVIITWFTGSTTEVDTYGFPLPVAADIELQIGLVGLTTLTVVPGSLKTVFQDSTATPYHYAEVTGLEPSTAYAYVALSNGQQAQQSSMQFPVGVGGSLDYPGTFTTLTTPPGKYLFTLALSNDLHFGEGDSGIIENNWPPSFEQTPGLPPYPQVMLEAMLGDLRQPDRGADRLIVAGDLTSNGYLSQATGVKQLLDGWGTLQRDYFVSRGNHDRSEAGSDWDTCTVVVRAEAGRRHRGHRHRSRGGAGRGGLRADRPGAGRPGLDRARLAAPAPLPAEEMRQDAMVQLGLIGGADPVLPEPSGSPLGDALSAVAAAAHAAITGYGFTRADLWPLLGRFGLARHLAPARAG